MSKKTSHKIIFTIIWAIIILVIIHHGILFYEISLDQRKMAKPLLQKTRMQKGKELVLNIDVPKCVDSQEIYLDISYDSEDKMKQFQNNVNICPSIEAGKNGICPCICG